MNLFPDLAPAPAEGADVAYTPDRYAEACLRTLGDVRCGDAPLTAWDPHAGGGAFCRAAWSVFGSATTVLATDIDSNAPALRPAFEVPPGGLLVQRTHDATRGLPHGWARPDWIVGNPPFSEMTESIQGALAVATAGVGFLMIGQWLAPQSRDWLWDTCRPDEVFWVRERIPFEGPGRNGKDTDAREYAWVVWRPIGTSRFPWFGRGLIRRLSVDGRTW